MNKTKLMAAVALLLVALLSASVGLCAEWKEIELTSESDNEIEVVGHAYVRSMQGNLDYIYGRVILTASGKTAQRVKSIDVRPWTTDPDDGRPLWTVLGEREDIAPAIIDPDTRTAYTFAGIVLSTPNGWDGCQVVVKTAESNVVCAYMGETLGEISETESGDILVRYAFDAPIEYDCDAFVGLVNTSENMLEWYEACTIREGKTEFVFEIDKELRMEYLPDISKIDYCFIDLFRKP